MIRKTLARVVLLGLVAGGVCGAAVGLGYASPLVGVAGAILIAVAVAVLVRRAKKEGKAVP